MHCFSTIRAWSVALAVTLIAGVSLALPRAAEAQVIMMPDSTNNTLVLFNAFDGSLVNGNFIPLAGGTPVHAMQVGEEIWVSEQIGDRISRWGFDGTFKGQVGGGATGGLDNVRGMGLINGSVFVTNSGTGNTAPGNAVVEYDTSGNLKGFFSTVGLAPSPFGILANQGSMLVSSSSANDDIHRFSMAGASLGTFHNSTTLNFAEQMNYATDGSILVAGFSSPAGIYRLDASSGAILQTIAASGPRGVIQLGNGNIMWSNGSGAHIFNTSTGGSTQVYTGGGRYLDVLIIPEPGTGAVLLGSLGLLGLRRRR